MSPSRQTLSHRRKDVERLQRLAGDSLRVLYDEARGEFVVATRIDPVYGSGPLCRIHRYEVAAAWLAGYATGLRYGGRV